MKRALVLVLAGGIVAALVQPFTPAGWWLDSSRGVAITSIVLAVAAVAVGFLARSLPLRNPIAAAASAFWLGANVGLAMVLFRSGPGTLFPIVLAIGAGISAVAVGAGAITGAALSTRLHWFDRH
jgi:hypothetical protein